MSQVSEVPPIRALLVDDDPMITMLLGAFLEGLGYTSESVSDGQQALARLASGGFNLVITDREMPNMDGLDLCRAVRALPGESYVYLIMLTSVGAEESLVAAMEAGVDDFLAKPMRPAELGARLRAAERVLALEAGLANRNRKLADAYGQLSRELELARSLQIGQLPAPASFGSWRFDWMFEASSYVGGDIFDYFCLDHRHLGFYLADVSGHGVAAAMMAFNAQHQLLAASQHVAASMLRDNGDLAATAVAAVTEYNRRFLQMKETSLYLTMVYGLIDMETRTAALVQAGHPAALVATGADGRYVPLGEGGLPVGILADPGYEAHTVTLPVGSRLVLYSDGITDCVSPQGETFGEQRLQELLAAQRGVPLGLSCGAVRRALREWRGGVFEDDVTLLALELR
jgi:sigma-B regulation protein RsbU (phosphoserine phosphatase)